MTTKNQLYIVEVTAGDTVDELVAAAAAEYSIEIKQVLLNGAVLVDRSATLQVGAGPGHCACSCCNGLSTAPKNPDSMSWRLQDLGVHAETKFIITTKKKKKQKERKQPSLAAAAAATTAAAAPAAATAATALPPPGGPDGLVDLSGAGDSLVAQLVGMGLGSTDQARSSWRQLRHPAPPPFRSLLL